MRSKPVNILVLENFTFSAIYEGITNILASNRSWIEDEQQSKSVEESETSPSMTLMTPQSPYITKDQVNPNHSSYVDKEIFSTHFTTNGTLTDGSSDSLVNNGLHTHTSDGSQTNQESHTSFPAEDHSMPIAVIGIGCRFPGDATSPDNLWKLISEGRSAHSGIPKDRFNIDAFYHPSGERQGSINLRGGYFLKDDIATFDAPFFSITPNEAKSMDPQQRLLLEVAYESLENAGQRMEDIVGSDTSCYVGSFTKDYSEILERDLEDGPKYHATGNGSAILSNRLSWFFDLKGPSITLDTACSSSLVCLHLACQSLRTGESKMAIVGGTNVILNPDIMILLTALNFLSPDSKCQAFDHKANGYARGEGIASVILKPLDAALRDNDLIRGVIRGTAVNQDGKTPGITLPSMEAQVDLINSAYKSAGLNLSETEYFEAHGTGTSAGDSLETGALATTFGKTRQTQSPLLVGTVKTNIGHVEGASGLAGLIKAIYVLEKGEIPGNLWLEKANPRIPMEAWKIKVPTELTPWPTDGLRRISVNSFGYGGTNAHVIVDDAYNYLRSRGLKGNHNTVEKPPEPRNLLNGSSNVISNGISPSPSTPKMNGTIANGSHYPTKQILAQNGYTSHETPDLPRLFVWSAHEQAGLERVGRSYATHLRSKPMAGIEESLMERLSYTLSCRRSILPWKSFCVASSINELCNNLEERISKPFRSSVAPKLAYVFTGQGAQWFAMGRELLSHEIFRTSLMEADAYLKSLQCTWSLFEEFCADEKESKINQAVYSQPICTALQVALVDLLRHWGVKPVAVIGHSSGEIAAAYCKGAISRESAWKISYHRGRLTNFIRLLAPHINGGMLVAGINEDQALDYLKRVSDGKVVIACVNSPSNVTISGDMLGINQLHEILTVDSVFTRKLKVETAYHSHHMNIIAAAYMESLYDLETFSQADSEIMMFSSVTGDIVKSTDLGSKYWVDNMISTVRFSTATQSLLSFSSGPKKRRSRSDKSAVDILLEIGPHSTLEGPLRQILQNHEANKSIILYLSVLSRGRNAFKSMLEAAGRIFAKGYPIDLAKVNNTRVEYGKLPAQVADLPSYPWNHSSRYWCESHISVEHRFRKHPRHDLFGAPTSDYNPLQPKWRNFIRKSENPWIQDHRIQSSILYPAAGMIVMAVEVAKQVADGEKLIKGYELRDINISKAIMIAHDEEGTETTIQMRPWKLGSRASTSTWQEFVICSKRKDQNWEENCSGLIQTHYEQQSETPNESFEEQAQNRYYQERYLEVKEACTFAEIPRQVYESLETIGMQYGPIFQNLIHLQSGNHTSTGSIRIPDTKAVMPHKFEFPCVIHPATLDTVFQLSLPALTGMKEPLKVPMLPTFVENIFISSSIKKVPGEELNGYAFAKDAGYRLKDSQIVIWASESTHPQIVIRGLRSMALPAMTTGNVLSDSLTNVRKLCLQPSWKEDVELMTRDQAMEVFRRAADALQQLDPIIIQELELAAFIYLQRALSTITSDQASGFVPHLKSLYGWMRHQQDLALKGGLEHQNSNYDGLNRDPDYEKKLLLRVAEQTVDGKLLCRLGENLEPMLKGEIEPLQLMLEDDILYNFYRYGVGLDEMNVQIVEYVDRLAHKKPDISILEIGAGTGGTTLPILERLGGHGGTSPRFSSYTFTDISAGVFVKVADKLKEWESYLTFQKLNIEEDPEIQGFGAGTYDVIIAVNVLHVSRNMSATLANVGSLLKPGGKLILGEVTHCLMRTTMTFGWLSGWWIGEEDGRKLGPTMTEDEWSRALIRQRFSGLDICLRDFKDSKDHLCSFMVSTASPTEHSIPSRNILVIQSSTTNEETKVLSNKLLEYFSTSGSSATTISLQDVTPSILNGKICIVLAEVESPLLHGIDEAGFNAIRNFALRSSGVLWITRGGSMNSQVPEANLIVGLARTIRSEHEGVTFITLDLDFNTSPAAEGTASAIIRLSESMLNPQASKTQDFEFSLQDGVIFNCRITAQKEMNDILADQSRLATPVLLPYFQPNRPLKLEVGVPGILDTLQFVDDFDASKPLDEEDIEIKVMASALNFVDIMVAMGQVPDTMIGADCSGIITRIGSNIKNFKPGDRVMTWKLGCHQTYVRSPGVMFQRIPDEMTFEVAASIPTIYCTSYHALYDCARLRKGESILIHAAAGGVGQSAIILAKHLGAEIFATVGSDEKKRLIISQYGIQEDHIFDSRNLSFASGIKRMTEGRGVDVVLNSLAGEALRETWHCLAMFGRFVEIGKKDIVGNTGLEMAPFMNNLMFVTVNLVGIYRHNIPLASRILSDVMDLVHQGVVRPITPITVYPYSEIESAFKLMQLGKHTGKIVLKPSDDDLVPIIPVSRLELKFDKNSTYVLAGGLGGLGRSMAHWMVDRGARNLVFLSRSGVQKEEARNLIKELTTEGARIAAYACDLGDEDRLRLVLQEVSRDLPPVKGVIQSAMVIQDSTFESMTSEDMAAALRPKVNGSWNLHMLLPKDMEFFVMLSSSAGIVGSRGQGNYSAGNTYQDALAHYRASKNLPAAAIDLGMILGVGYVAESSSDGNGSQQTSVVANLKNLGLVGIREEEFLAILAAAITSFGKVGTNIPCQVITGLSTGGMMLQNDAPEDPYWFNDARFSHLRLMDTQASIKETSSTGPPLQRLLSEVNSIAAATTIICEAIAARLAKSLRVPLEDLDPSKPVNAYGVDSLIAVELRNFIFREVKADMSIFDILSSIPLAMLSSKIAASSSLVQAAIESEQA